jgi:hypothetical protein
MPPTPNEAAAVRREAIGTADDSDLIALGDIDWYWTHGGNETVLLTAALVCEMLAARIGGTRVAIATVSGTSMNRSMQPVELRKRAVELRRRYRDGNNPAVGAVSTVSQAIWSDSPDAFDDDDGEFSV